MLIQQALRLSSIDTLDRELLLASVLMHDRAFLLAHPDYPLSDTKVERFKLLLARRKRGEPLAYITGEKEFFGLSFHVNRSTLIPRPETELLVEQAIQRMENKKKQIAVIDVGTGSGCIIISLVKHLLDSRFMIHDSRFQFFATDISKRALTVAEKNARRHGVEGRITFVQSDLLENLQSKLKRFDELIILANLPYLSELLYRNTEPTVRNFEPQTALVSGPDGLDHYRGLLTELAILARTQKVRFLLEISPEQTSLLPKLCRDTGAQVEEILPDLAGKCRVARGSF